MPRPGVCDARTGRDGFDSEPSVFALQVSGTVLSPLGPLGVSCSGYWDRSLQLLMSLMATMMAMTMMRTTRTISR